MEKVKRIKSLDDVKEIIQKEALDQWNLWFQPTHHSDTPMITDFIDKAIRKRISREMWAAIGVDDYWGREEIKRDSDLGAAIHRKAKEAVYSFISTDFVATMTEKQVDRVRRAMRRGYLECMESEAYDFGGRLARAQLEECIAGIAPLDEEQ